MASYDSLSFADMNAALEDMRDVFIKEIFHGDLARIPVVRFGLLQRKLYPVRFAVGVHKTSNDIADEITIGANISQDREKVATMLLYGLIMEFAQCNGIKVASRQGTYLNHRFSELADKFGLIVTDDPKYGFKPVWISDHVIAIIQKHRWMFQVSRDKYTYSRAITSEHSIKYVCEGCGANVRATKKQSLYCANCLNRAASQRFGKAWDIFINQAKLATMLQE